MKYLLTFVAGAVIGAVGSILWLRKDIKKTLDEKKNAQNDADLPFTMGENGEKDSDSSKTDKNSDKVTSNAPVDLPKREQIEYNKISESTKNGTNDIIKPPLSGNSSGNNGYSPQVAPVPILPRDKYEENDDDYDDEEESVVPNGEIFFEIDRDDYDNNPDYNKKVLIYYLGDRVMATEAGTKIENPSLFVGTQWDQYIGNYAENTSFVRNERVHEDYMIHVEYGTYVDEYGLED